MAPDAALKSVQVRIQGRVQGVWFRGWTVQEASRLRLSGWVRNCADGSVEAVFCGATKTVDLMLSMCWDGPTHAQVSSVADQPCDPPPPGFRHLVRPEQCLSH